MAGTRLIVHTTFVIQLLILVLTSFHYAAKKKQPAILSVDPFVIDRSGVALLTEPIDSGGFVAEVVNIIFSFLEKLTGEKHVIQRPKSNPFVDEMRHKASKVLSDVNPNSPLLNIQLVISQSSPELLSGSKALKRRLEEYSAVSVNVSTIYSEAITSCDDYNYEMSHRNSALIPQVVMLTGCSVDGDKDAVVEISRDAPVFVVRTRTLETEKLEQLLEGHVASIISKEILNVVSSSNKKLSTISVELIDENPLSRSSTNDGASAKVEFESMGIAFAESVRTIVHPILTQLSGLYGGQVHVDSNLDIIIKKSSIESTAHVSAYLPLPDEVIESNEVDEGASTKYISTEQVANWAEARMTKHQSSGYEDNIHWILFVPSRDHSPLMVHDENSGGEGTSVTFRAPTHGELAGGRGSLSGLSLVNLDPSHQGRDWEVDTKMLQQSLQNATTSALLYLVGYIRAYHGLPSLPDHSNGSTSNVSVKYIPPTDIHPLTFWEMEAISRNHLNSTLEKVLYEIDALMALLCTHRGLAFTDRLAHKLNNATHLLRHSISLIEQGYPTHYATSTLYGSLHHLESVTTDPDLMELQHFALDHYLAVFSPLILPLMMPLMIGLVREIKRYRKLKSMVVEDGGKC
jgi:phosphatidylinositol glycan class S